MLHERFLVLIKKNNNNNNDNGNNLYGLNVLCTLQSDGIKTLTYEE